MERAEPVGATTPDSRTGDSPAVPFTPPAGTPDPLSGTPTPTPGVDSPRPGLLRILRQLSAKEGRRSGGPTPTVPSPAADSPKGSATEKEVAGTPSDRDSAIGVTPPAAVDSSRKDVDASSKKELPSLRTAADKTGFGQLDANGQPLKVQERVTYQHMIARYAYWKNMRGPVLAYIVLLICVNVYGRHHEEAKRMAQFVADEGRNIKHVHCCCHPYYRQLYKDYKVVRLDPEEEFKLTILTFIIGILSPLWERFIGRRKMLIGLVTAALPASVLIAIGESLLQKAGCCYLELCYTQVTLITTTSLLEMLPYENRYLAPYSFFLAANICSAFAIIHFHWTLNMTRLAVVSAAASLIGLFVIRYYIKDSICHLNIRNKVERIEKTFRKEEKRLHVEKREGSSKFHEMVARKIFEDLVFLDEEELKFSVFFKRIWKNFHMIEIILAIVQALSAGAHEYENHHFISERFDHPDYNSMDRVLGYALAGIILLFAKNHHRNKALCWMLAAMLCNSAARHALVVYDKSISCSMVQVVEKNFDYMSSILSITACALCNSILCMIVLRFLESTPSVLRSTCIMLIYTPYLFVSRMADAGYRDPNATEVTHAWKMIATYNFHVVVIVLTMMRTRSRLPFALYLFDLIPSEQRSDDNNDEDGCSKEVVDTTIEGGSTKEITAPGIPSNRENGSQESITPKSNSIKEQKKTGLNLKKLKRIMKSRSKEDKEKKTRGYNV